MPTPATCLRCGKQLFSSEVEGGATAYCSSCAAEGIVPEAAVIGSDNAQNIPQMTGPPEGAITTHRAEKPTWSADPEDRLELGPRWRQVERAFSWIRFGVTALMVGLICHFLIFLALLLDQQIATMAAMARSLALAAAGFSLFGGQLLCLRVPVGTRARPEALTCLIARLVAFGLNVFGAVSLLDADSSSGIARDSGYLLAFALLLGGTAVSFSAEFAFLAFLRRIGRFLEDGSVLQHVHRLTGMLVGYILALLVVGSASVAWMYQTVLSDIATWKTQFPMADARSFSWLLGRIANVFLASNGRFADYQWGPLLTSAVAAAFGIALVLEYRAALCAVNATIEVGLALGEAR